jgi:hypothetical protein
MTCAVSSGTSSPTRRSVCGPLTGSCGPSAVANPDRERPRPCPPRAPGAGEMPLRRSQLVRSGRQRFGRRLQSFLELAAVRGHLVARLPTDDERDEQLADASSRGYRESGHDRDGTPANGRKMTRVRGNAQSCDRAAKRTAAPLLRSICGPACQEQSGTRENSRARTPSFSRLLAPVRGYLQVLNL